MDTHSPESGSGLGSKSDTCRAFRNAIEHLTHLSTSELSLETPLVTSDVSLFQPLLSLAHNPTPTSNLNPSSNHRDRNNVHLPPPLIGAILQRQVQALLGNGSGRSARQKRVYEAVSGVLRDLLEVYSRERYPVRRAGVLVQMLEHAYYCVPGGGGDGGESSLDLDSERMVREVEVLTADTVSSSFVPVRSALLSSHCFRVFQLLLISTYLFLFLSPLFPFFDRGT